MANGLSFIARLGRSNKSRSEVASQQTDLPAGQKSGRYFQPTRSALGLLSFFLLYLIIKYSIPEGLSTNLPQIALSLNAQNPRAVVNFAEQSVHDELQRRAQKTAKKQQGSISTLEKPAELNALSKMLIGALTMQPLNARAFRLLGQISGLSGDEKKTLKMMALAAKQSPEESIAVSYMMNQSLAANNARAAIFYADILMRSNTFAEHRVAPLVARLFQAPAAQGELARRLGANPPWRALVLGSFPSSGLSDPQAPFLVFAAMSDSPNPISERELLGYITYLLNQRMYSFAFSIWRQFLTPADAEDKGFLYNGSFERKPSGLPFDWTIIENSEIKSGIFARPDDNNHNALFVSFGLSRAAFPTIRQTMVLKPGAYHLKGQFQGELLARRGLQWRVSCVEGAIVGESQMLIGRVPKWETFEFDFTIPNDKCAAQYFQLFHMARSPSEQLVSGEMWFDEIEILEDHAKQATYP